MIHTNVNEPALPDGTYRQPGCIYLSSSGKDLHYIIRETDPINLLVKLMMHGIYLIRSIRNDGKDGSGNGKGHPAPVTELMQGRVAELIFRQEDKKEGQLG